MQNIEILFERKKEKKTQLLVDTYLHDSGHMQLGTKIVLTLLILATKVQVGKIILDLTYSEGPRGQPREYVISKVASVTSKCFSIRLRHPV